MVAGKENPAAYVYRWWLAVDSALAVGLGLRSFILPLLTLVATGSVVQAGLVGTVEGLTVQAVLVLGGVIIDRFDRRRLILLNSLLSVGVTGLVGGLALAGMLSWPVLLGSAVLFGLLGGLFGEASDAALRSVITAEEYPKAVTVNEGRDAAIRLAAAPVGGWLLEIMGGASMLVAGVFHALAALFVGKLRLKPPAAASESGGVFRRLSEAARWLKGRQRAMPLAFMVGMANFGVAGVMTTTQYLTVERTGSTLDAGLLTTAAGVSVIIGAILANPLVSRVKTGSLIALAFTWMTTGVLLLAVFNRGLGLVILLVVTFIAVPTLNAALTGFFFSATPERMQGRVQALLGTFTAGMAALAPLVVGLSLRFGSAWVAYAAALLPMLVAMVTALVSRPIREIPKPKEWQNLEL